MQNRKQYITLSLVFLAIIGIPAIQTLTRVLPEIPLNGVSAQKPLPDLTVANWMQFRYQPEFNKRVEQTFGFRPAFVRLYNQADYSLFRQPHGSGVVIGKEGYLYEEWFITAYYGLDYIGKDRITQKVKQLKRLRSYFRKMGKEMVIMIAPGKAAFYPEFIPDRWKDSLRITNYDAMTEGIIESGIPLLDFNKYFLAIKDSSGCPIFPRTGTHWSHYAARLAADSLSGYLSGLLQRPLPDFRLGPAIPSDTLVYPDNDLEKLLNLFLPLPQNPLCYPEVISEPEAGFSLPSAIVIGDSFFWELFNLPLKGRIFSEVKFWYYNSTVFPDSETDSVRTTDLKFPDALLNTDLIILQANRSNIHNIGWGFQERVVGQLIDPAWQLEYDKMVREYIQAIHNTPEWEQKVIRDASDKGIPTDSMIKLNAIYMVEQYLLNNDLF